MKALYSLFACGLAALALTACVSQPAPRTPAPVDAAQAQANDRLRGELGDWDLSGRIAVSNGSRGGSGRIDWQQRAAEYTIALSAPVTRQSWQLRGNEHGARLDGIAGGPREDADVEALLLSATGWTIPVRALQDWVRGIGAADDQFGATRRVYGSGGLPLKLEQAGWAIEYEEWYPAEAGAPQLPRRIVARKGTASVRLVVDDWDVGAR